MAVAEFILRAKDEATAAVARLRAELVQLSSQYKDTAGSTDTAGKKVEGFRSGVDEAGDTASKFAQALGLISPEAQAMAMVLADAADGAVGLADAAKLSGVSLGSLAVVGGTLVAALGAAVLVYQDFTREAELASQVAETQHDIMLSLRDATRELQDAQLDLLEAQGEITSAQRAGLEAQTNAQRAVEDYSESLRTQQQELRKTAESAEFWSSMDQGLGWVDSVMGWSETAAAAREQLDALDASVVAYASTVKETAQVQQEVIALEAEEGETRERTTAGIERKADASAVLAQAQQIMLRGLTAEARATVEAQRALEQFILEMNAAGVTAQQVAPALEHLAQELDAAAQAEAFAAGMAEAQAELEAWVPSVSRGTEVLASFYDQLAGLVPEATLTDLEKLQMAVLELNAAFAAGDISPEAYSAALEAAGAASQGLQAQGGAARAEGAAGAINAVSGGVSGLTSLLAAAGPQAMIAAAVIGLVKAISDGLLTSLVSEVATLLDTVGNLAPMVLEFVDAVLRNLVPAALENAAALVEGVLGILLPGLVLLLLDPQLWLAVGKALAMAVGTILLSVLGLVVGLFGDIIRGAQFVVDMFRDLTDPSWWRGVGEAVVQGIKDAFSAEGRERRQERREENFGLARDWVGENGGGLLTQGPDGRMRNRMDRRMRRQDQGGTTVNIGGGLILGTVREVKEALARVGDRLNVRD